MADPHKRKTAHVNMQAKSGLTGEFINFNGIIDESFKELGEEEVKAILLEEIKKTSPNMGNGITIIQPFFSYDNEDAMKDFDYGNVFVEAHLPYCLHIPNDYELEVLLTAPNDAALLTPKKIWTKKATTDGKVSDEADFYADDRLTYLKDSVFLTPQMPVDPRDGWEQNYTGTNLQKIKDTNGVFRFTRLYIQFNMEVKEEDLKDKERTEKVLNAVKEKALDAVNKLIDTYRFTTKQEYITRLGTLSINMIYFTKLNQGLYVLPMNVETATINRSKFEIEAIEKMLEEGQKPDLCNLLLLDAENSYNNKDYALAVVQSYQGLEIFIENFLVDKLQKNKGLTEQEAIDFIATGDNWKTKTRLKEVLREATGFTLENKDQPLWTNWCSSYKETRNKVIHKGKDASEAEVKKALAENLQVIAIMKTL
ncbi:MAG: hypothetical protein WCQ32_01380 [bacterium]